MAKGKNSTIYEAPMDMDWQCSNDADTLARAAEVIADKKRFAAAKAHVEKKQKGLDQLMNGLRRRT